MAIESDESKVFFGRKKSPQELLLQATEKFSTSSFNVAEEKRKVQLKERLDLLWDLDDEALMAKLSDIERESRESGIFSQDKLLERESDEFQQLRQAYIDLGHDELSANFYAEVKAKDSYTEALRRHKTAEEVEINKVFESYLEEGALPQEKEKAEMAKLSEICFDLSNPEDNERLARLFPGGNFLFHGTKVESAISILENGNLKSAFALHAEEEVKAAKVGRDVNFVRDNSGSEGISWNFNNIGALPGDRFHLVGFLAAPKDVLADNTILTIPSRPAPHELIQLPSKVNPNDFYFAKNQYELFYPPMSSASVRANLVNAYQYLENDRFRDGGGLRRYLVGLKEDPSNVLRELYKVEDGQLKINSDLIQLGKGKEVPAGAVYLQYLIDSGATALEPRLGDIKNVRDFLDRFNDAEVQGFLNSRLRIDMKKPVSGFEEQMEKVEGIADKVEDMFILLPRKDRLKWMKVLAASEHKPKGIVFYDGATVRLEDFASKHVGDKDKLTEQITTAIKPSEGYIDFEQDLLGKKIQDSDYTGHAYQVLKESAISHRPTIELGDSGIIIGR